MIIDGHITLLPDADVGKLIAEMDEAGIENIIENCRAELTESKFIQSEETIRQEMKKHIPENKKLLFELLKYK